MIDPGNARVPQVVLALLVVAVAAVLVGAASTSASDFSAYNPDWNGVSDLRSMGDDGMRVTAAAATRAYGRADPDRTVAVVLAPESAYGQRDLVALRAFVAEGGRLVVAGDGSAATDRLLGGLGASARLDGRPLRDVRSNYGSPAMPVATGVENGSGVVNGSGDAGRSGVANGSLVGNASSVTLNYGTAVRPNGASVLVNTSEYAYLDADRDGALGPNETLGTYAVATVEPVGDGRIVVVGDASVFINAMLDRPGNREFARGLLSGRTHLLLDYSHANGLPPLRRAVFALRRSTAGQLVVGALAVGAVAVLAHWRDVEPTGEDSNRPGRASYPNLVGWIPRRWRGVVPGSERDPSDGAHPCGPVLAPPDGSGLAAAVSRRHPDWDRERVERVVEAGERHGRARGRRGTETGPPDEHDAGTGGTDEHDAETAGTGETGV